MLSLNAKLKASEYLDASVGKRERIDYVRSRTGEYAVSILDAYYFNDFRTVFQLFINVDDMLTLLINAFADEFETEKKMDEYMALTMKKN